MAVALPLNDDNIARRPRVGEPVEPVEEGLAALLPLEPIAAVEGDPVAGGRLGSVRSEVGDADGGRVQIPLIAQSEPAEEVEGQALGRGILGECQPRGGGVRVFERFLGGLFSPSAIPRLRLLDAEPVGKVEGAAAAAADIAVPNGFRSVPAGGRVDVLMAVGRTAEPDFAVLRLALA